MSFYSGNLVKKINCWEYKRCGREPGGLNAEDSGICPAASHEAYDGTHGGGFAGRACWLVAGTMCDGEVQGTFAQKFKNCMACDFYLLVMKEEGKRT